MIVLILRNELQVCSPIFKNVENTMETLVSKLEYLDMSMATIQPKGKISLFPECVIIYVNLFLIY